MKNLILGLMLLLGTSSSLANSSTNFDNDYGTCTLTVTHYNSQGNVIGTTVYTSNQPDALSCSLFAHNIGRLYGIQQ